MLSSGTNCSDVLFFGGVVCGCGGVVYLRCSFCFSETSTVYTVMVVLNGLEENSMYDLLFSAQTLCTSKHKHNMNTN